MELKVFFLGLWAHFSSLLKASWMPFWNLKKWDWDWKKLEQKIEKVLTKFFISISSFIDWYSFITNKKHHLSYVIWLRRKRFISFAKKKTIIYIQLILMKILNVCIKLRGCLSNFDSKILFNQKIPERFWFCDFDWWNENNIIFLSWKIKRI